MKERSRSRIPRFNSRDEEAQFWDTHSVADFADELEVVEAKIERPLQHLLGVRFDARTITKLGQISRRKGIGPSTLVRMWILERLGEEEAQEVVQQGP